MSTATKQWFAPPPMRVIGDVQLDAVDLRTLMAIAAHDRLGANGAGCHASPDRLAALVGCHKNSLFRAITKLKNKQYITVESHPLNGRLRVYRVLYTDFDRLYFTGMKAGTANQHVSDDAPIDNELVSDATTITNQLVSETAESLTRPDSQVTNLACESDLNIFPEGDNKSCETGNRFSEAASPEHSKIVNGSEAEPSQGLLKQGSGIGVSAMLAMIERDIKAGKRPPFYLTYLEKLVSDGGGLDYLSPEYGRAFRMLEQYGDRLEGSGS